MSHIRSAATLYLLADVAGLPSAHSPHISSICLLTEAALSLERLMPQVFQQMLAWYEQASWIWGNKGRRRERT